MIIKGNTVGTPMPRTNYEQTDPAKADYLKGKNVLDQKIENAQTAANNAQTAADNAQTAANNAQTAADNAQATADNAKNESLAKAGGTMTGPLNVIDPTENAHAANKGYVDEKRKVFTTTLTVNDWEGSAAPYTQRIGIEGILSTDRPHYTAVYDANQETRLAQKEAFAMVDDLETEDGVLIFTCFEEKPEVDMTIQLEVNR